MSIVCIHHATCKYGAINPFSKGCLQFDPPVPLSGAHEFYENWVCYESNQSVYSCEAILKSWTDHNYNIVPLSGAQAFYEN